MLPMPYASGVSKVMMRITYIWRLCAFCRVSINFTDKEYIEKIKQRMELNDAAAFNELGMKYRGGDMNCGLKQLSLDLLERIIFFSCYAYFGNGELDIKKGTHHRSLQQ